MAMESRQWGHNGYRGGIRKDYERGEITGRKLQFWIAVWELIRRKRRWVTTNEIVEQCNVNQRKAQRAMYSFARSGFVDFKKNPIGGPGHPRLGIRLKRTKAVRRQK